MPGNIELIARLLFAAVLGGVIGFERERFAFPAGLRTHMLVCVASSLVMIVSAFGFEDTRSMPNVALDPSRVAAQVVSGIGFLGAGAILLRGEVVRGLTTAASLWSVAAIGLAVGGGLYLAAVTATVIILVILAGIKPLEKRFFAARQRRELRLVVDRGAMNVATLYRVLGPGSARVKQFIVQQNESLSDTDEVTITLSRVSAADFNEICGQLSGVEGVREVIEVGGP